MRRFVGTKSPQLREAVERGSLIGLGREPGTPVQFKAFRKTVLTYAIRMLEPFEVETIEGLHSGKAGDWLAIGPAGEMYPIDAAVFESSYEEVPS